MESDSENSENLEFRESFGDFLRRHREASGKSLEAVARTTRIPKRYLLAFEENDSARFPEEAFTRGFLRSYAMEIGLEVEETISRYERFQRSLMPTQIKEIKKPASKFIDLDANPSPFVSNAKLRPFLLGGAGLVVLLACIFIVKGVSSRLSKASHSVVKEAPVASAAESAANTEAASNTIGGSATATMQTPVAPSTLSVKAIKKGSLNVRLDENPAQEVALKDDETKVFSVYKEVEIKTNERAHFQFQYNGKPLEVSGTSIKLFNRNLFSSSAKP